MQRYRFFVPQARRDTDGALHGLRGIANRFSCSSFVAAHELILSVNDHLRCKDTSLAKLGRVGALPLAQFMRRVRISPSDIIRIIHVFAENDQLRAINWLIAV